MLELLRTNLQFFAQENDEETTVSNDESTEVNDTDETTTEGEPDITAESKTFTQEDIDRIVKERLSREQARKEKEIEKARAEEEQKRLSEQGEYKELADKYKAELEALRLDAVKAKKETLLAKAGYDDKQVEKYVKYLDGETDEELNAALDELKADIPPKKTYADPSAGNGSKKTPATTDLSEKGKSAYQRLKEKGKIRGAK